MKFCLEVITWNLLKRKKCLFCKSFFSRTFKKNPKIFASWIQQKRTHQNWVTWKCTWFPLLNDLPVFKLHTFKMAALKIFQHLIQGTLIIQWNIPKNNNKIRLFELIFTVNTYFGNKHAYEGYFRTYMYICTLRRWTWNIDRNLMYNQTSGVEFEWHFIILMPNLLYCTKTLFV